MVHQKTLLPVRAAAFFIFNRGDSNPERVRSVRKTVRGTVFQRRSAKAGTVRLANGRRARKTRSGFVPDGSPKNAVARQGDGVFYFDRGDSNPFLKKSFPLAIKYTPFARHAQGVVFLFFTYPKQSKTTYFHLLFAFCCGIL